jgi:serine/threonine-protein kinase
MSGASSEPTGAYQPPEPPRAPDERFGPGALLAGRYRIVAPLGRGGMGEVFRADDLVLGQPVALKFLPVHIAHDPDRLARFRKEVAAARQVSHPNVCRVYDIADHDGQSFLTMEFVDGEDLSSVLKRFGRVPEDKGLEIARQLCSALAAVHEEGLLHRDLKPANVMLDGRGKVRLTDFGLAAAAEDLSASEVRSGTPLYQAPEQLAGREVTVRSDVYALGLVLYELFTGKRAFPDAKRDTPPSKPSSHVSGLNPVLEGAILRCLEPEPVKRPRSALAVLGALPGGDPLAAALAAGETPSPQLVADAGAVGLIDPRIGVALFGGLVLVLAAAFALARVVQLHSTLPALAAPAVQEQTARELLDHLGAGPGFDTTSGYRYNHEVFQQVRQREAGPERFPHLRGGRTYLLTYFVRRSPAALGTRRNLGIGHPDEPAPSRPGMFGVKLDGSGRLLEFYRVPASELTEPAPGPPRAPWERLLESARFGSATVTPVEPRWTPPVFADARAAWEVTDADGTAYHAEAAALRGQPVWFRLAHDQERTAGEVVHPYGRIDWLGVAFYSILGCAGVLAVRNWVRGRADVRGMALTAGLAAAGALTFWLTLARFPADGLAALEMMTGALGEAGLLALFVGVSYLALEPIARRRWPWYLSAWSRLLAGRVRDPLVGRDILLGLTAGAVVTVLGWMALVSGQVLAADRSSVQLPASPVFERGTLSLVSEVGAAIYMGLFAFALFLLFGFVVRKTWLGWLAVGAFMILLGSPFTAPSAARSGAWACWLLLSVVLFGVLVLVAARFGLLSVCAATLSVRLLTNSPLTLDTGSWYFWNGAGAVLVLLALAAWACYTATGGQRLFKNGVFGDD